MLSRFSAQHLECTLICRHVKVLLKSYLFSNLLSTINRQRPLTANAQLLQPGYWYFVRTIGELQSQLDYERLRREKLEAQIDEYRRENAYLGNKLQEVVCHHGYSNVSIQCALSEQVVINSFVHFGNYYPSR